MKIDVIKEKIKKFFYDAYSIYKDWRKAKEEHKPLTADVKKIEGGWSKLLNRLAKYSVPFFYVAIIYFIYTTSGDYGSFAMGWYVSFPLTIIVLWTLYAMAFAPKMQGKPYKKIDGKAVPGKAGLYTLFEPGIIKVIVKGDTLVDILMRFPGRGFRKEIEGNLPPEDGYEIVEMKDRNILSLIHFPSPSLWDILIGPTRYFWWLSKVTVFKTNGRLFNGVPPWREVRTYELDYLKVEEGKLVTSVTRSNQFRALPFDVYIEVPDVETSDPIELRVVVYMIARVFNPWLAAFGPPPGESWYSRMSGLVSTVTTKFYRENSYQGVLKSVDGLIASIEELGHTKFRNKDTKDLESERHFFNVGVEITYVSVFRQNPTDPKLVAALNAKAEATALADATREITSAIEDDTGRLVYNREATIRTVKSAPEGAIVTIDTTGKAGGGDNDAVIKGILSELKKKNSNKEE